MRTIILCRGKFEIVNNHKQPIPFTESGSCDYDKMRERIEAVYRERIKRNLCEVF